VHQVRPAAVAGAFYPADPQSLTRSIDASLMSCDTLGGVVPKALIVPHAGYIYSGPVAASAYARLRPARAKIHRVVLLGPTHRVAIQGLATSSAEAFRTPLGTVPVDRNAQAEVLDLPQVCIDDRAHAFEHSLEVQLPFLQRVLEKLCIVPFAVGDATDEEVSEVLERLWGGDETLIVISSDLSHYHDYEAARRLDLATTRAIEALEPEGLGWESACGRIPIRGLLRSARRHGLRVATLDLRSSGDTAGPREEVVGYGAYAFT